MASAGDCTKILSELADQYESSSCLLSKLEESLQGRTHVSSLVQCDSCSTGTRDEQVEAASQLSVFKAKIVRLQLDDGDSTPTRRTSSSGEDECSDAEIEAELSGVRQQSIRNPRHNNGNESPLNTTVRRALSYQTSRCLHQPSPALSQRDMRLPQSPLHLHQHPDDRFRLSFGSLNLDMTSLSFPSANTSPTTAASLSAISSFRALSESSPSLLPDLNQRRLDRKSLAINGTPLIPSALSRASRPNPAPPPPPLLSDSAVSRGPHVLPAWTSGCTSSGNSSPVARTQPLFRTHGIPEPGEEDAGGDLPPTWARGHDGGAALVATALMSSRRDSDPAPLAARALQRRLTQTQQDAFPGLAFTSEPMRFSSGTLPKLQVTRIRRQTEHGVLRPGEASIVVTSLD